MNEPQTTILDPTSLTTQQLWREIAALKELLGVEIDSVKTAIEVAHDDLVRVPTNVQEAVASLKELLEQRIADEAKLRDEKFAGVQNQFDSGRVAVDAALAAVKEAGNKTEAGFTKQIDQLTALFQKGIDGVATQIDDLKDRMNRRDGQGEGSKETKTSQMDSNRYLIAIVGLALAILAFIAGRGGL